MDLAWDDLRTVLALVRGGTLAAAGDELGVNYTTIARRIRRAEAALGTPLFERLTDGYSPTEAAERVAAHAAEMEASCNTLLRKLEGARTDLAGPLTFTAPQLVIGSFLAPVIDAFTKAHPQIDLRVRATNTLLDLNRREADLALRISDSPGDNLKGLRLLEQHSASFATQDWADRIAADPTVPIDWVVYEGHPHVPKACDPRYTRMRVHLKFDDMVAIQGAAQAGLGVARMPMFLGRVTPGLVQVPVLPPQPYAAIWVVSHADLWASPRIASFRRMLVAHAKARRADFVA